MNPIYGPFILTLLTAYTLGLLSWALKRDKTACLLELAEQQAAVAELEKELRYLKAYYRCDCGHYAECYCGACGLSWDNPEHDKEG